MERYRIQPEASVYFLTYSVVEWLPIFVSEKSCRIVTDSLLFCHRQKNLGINAYVIMPAATEGLLFASPALCCDPCRHNGDHATVFWRPERETGAAEETFGQGVSHFPPCFAEVLREKAGEDRARRLWQPSRHPEAIQTEPFWRQKLDYLHDNPRRKGLVRQPDHWRFSSAAFFLSDGPVDCDVPITQIAW